MRDGGRHHAGVGTSCAFAQQAANHADATATATTQQTPGGAAQTAIIRIQSDAAVNPELEIEVITDPLVIIPVDGGPEVDAGDADAGETDAGQTDAGDVDAGEEDAGIADAGVVDAGEDDAGVDAGVVDAGAIDAGTPDAGVTDSGVSDAGN